MWPYLGPCHFHKNEEPTESLYPTAHRKPQKEKYYSTIKKKKSWAKNLLFILFYNSKAIFEFFLICGEYISSSLWTPKLVDSIEPHICWRYVYTPYHT